jgi:hypothetical protein
MQQFVVVFEIHREQTTPTGTMAGRTDQDTLVRGTNTNKLSPGPAGKAESAGAEVAVRLFGIEW